MTQGDIAYSAKDIKFPDNYHSICSGFPSKSFYIHKGLEFGLTWAGLSEYKADYLPKAISRWKHNLRKQLTKEEYWQVTTRTVLFYANEEQLTTLVEMHIAWCSGNTDWKNIWSNVLP